MRDVAVAGDLVGGVDDDHPLAQVVGEHARGLAQHRGLADAGATHDQDRLPGLDEVRDDLDGAVDRAPDPAGQPDDLAAAVADGADAVERPLDAGAVVVAEQADVLDHERDVGIVDLAVEEHDLRVREPALRAPTEVHHDLDQRLALLERVDGVDDLRRQGREQRVEVVDRFPLTVLGSHADLHWWTDLAHAGRHEGRLGHADEGFLHEQCHAGDRIEGSLLQSAIERCFIGSHG